MRSLNAGSTFVTFFIWLAVGRALGAEVAIVPISATGPHFVLNDQITVLTSGQRIWLEVRLSGWDPTLEGQILLKVWQMTIDPASFESGSLGYLQPAIELCKTDQNCMEGLGAGSRCGPFPVPSDRCAAGFQDTENPDWVHACCLAVGAVKLEPPPISFGSVTLDDSAAADPGEWVYGGTLVLDAHPAARGTFVIRPLADSTGTFMLGQEDVEIPISRLVPAFVNILPNDACCLSNGTCSNTSTSSCVSLNRIPVAGTMCLGDGDGTRIDDACEEDCNMNRTWDTVDLELARSLDCNGNSVPDECDLDSKESADCNINGVPDECEELAFGDLTNDGRITLDDLPTLGFCQTSPCLGPVCKSAQYPHPCCRPADSNFDGDVDLRDVNLFLQSFDGRGER